MFTMVNYTPDNFSSRLVSHFIIIRYYTRLGNESQLINEFFQSLLFLFLTVYF